MEKGFYWVRNRACGILTIACCSGHYWFILNGLTGGWTEAEVREDYEILDRISEPRS
jgi:hypothetical protein